ncbi:MAG: YdeI/OmpD-associated family protein [Cumulibacter sp.]
MGSQDEETPASYGEHGIVFEDRAAMRTWLASQGEHAEGVWLVFGKGAGPRTLSAAEALEEALCHGWIDGQMKRVDDLAYVKYFAPRRRGSKWSARNSALIQKLVKQGVVTPAGMDAKADGTWNTPATPTPSSDQNEELDALIAGHEPAYANWSRMSSSVRRTYARAYFDAKTEQTRARRLEWIVGRLHQNLKPM